MRGHGERLDVLVLDADQRQSLVCVRSLGAAGLRVGAFDVGAHAPAFSSRWCAVHGVLPDYSADPDAFVDGLLDVIGEYAPRVLMLAHDGSIEAVRSRRGEIEAATALALASEEALEIAVDKTRTLALADELGVPAPRTVPVGTSSDLRAAVSEVGLPAVVKPQRSWVEGRNGGDRLASKLVVDFEEAQRAAEEAFAAGGSVVVQEWVSGSREAVWLLVSGGRVCAEFAQVARRMVPTLGGSSVVRESVPVPRDLREAAYSLVRSAGLEGYSEVEFRRDRDGRAMLMEINPRLSASIELAVRAGVDFPRLLYAWAAGLPVASRAGYRLGLTMRWLGGDLVWLHETLRRRGRPDVMHPARALAAFAGDFFRPAAYDYVTASDLRPAFVATAGFVRMAASRVRRDARGRPQPRTAAQ